MLKMETAPGALLTAKRQVHLLLVEDSESDALLIQSGLDNDARLDVTVTRVARLAEALAAVESDKFDAVVADLNLPDSRGVATFERLRTALAEVPLIVLSGFDDHQLAAQILNGGALDCLSKNEIGGLSLARAIRYAIGQHDVQAELHRSSEHLVVGEWQIRSIVESNANPVAIVSPDGIVRHVNHAAEQMFGRGVDLLSGQPIGFPVGSGAASGLDEMEFTRADGTAGIANVVVLPISWGGEPAYLASLSDVTSRVTATREIKSALDRLRAVVANAPIIMWTLDERGVVTLCEGMLLERLSLSPGDVLGQSIFELFPNHSKIKSSAERALAGETVHQQIGLSGLTIDTWQSPVSDHKGRIVGMIGMGIDVTERLRLEEQVRQAQKMEAVGRLAGGVAHDFNNLLTVISSCASLAIEELHSLPSVRVEIEQIQRAADSAARLISQLLAFSRRQIVQPRVLDLGVEIGRLEPMLRRLIGEDVSLVTRLQPHASKIKVDVGQIEQVILNLVVNARDAMPTGGTLTIETSLVELNANVAMTHHDLNSGTHVLLSIADTGIGMDEVTRNAVFEPFFTTKGPGQGTGLGLATVYGIVKQSGGAIFVESEPDHGTTFKMYWPITAEAPVTTNAPHADGSTQGGKETVLLVEDQEGIRHVVTTALERSGYNVVSATSGAEALRVCDQYDSEIHLLLTDVVMPSMSGTEVATLVRARRPDTRVIFMSGYADDTIARHGILDSSVAFIHKPFTLAALRQKVRDVLNATVASAP